MLQGGQRPAGGGSGGGELGEGSSALIAAVVIFAGMASPATVSVGTAACPLGDLPAEGLIGPLSFGSGGAGGSGPEVTGVGA